MILPLVQNEQWAVYKQKIASGCFFFNIHDLNHFHRPTSSWAAFKFLTQVQKQKIARLAKTSGGSLHLSLNLQILTTTRGKL